MKKKEIERLIKYVGIAGLSLFIGTIIGVLLTNSETSRLNKVVANLTAENDVLENETRYWEEQTHICYNATQNISEEIDRLKADISNLNESLESCEINKTILENKTIEYKFEIDNYNNIYIIKSFALTLTLAFSIPLFKRKSNKKISNIKLIMGLIILAVVFISILILLK